MDRTLRDQANKRGIRSLLMQRDGSNGNGKLGVNVLIKQPSLRAAIEQRYKP